MKEEKVQNIGPSKIEIVYQRFGNPSSPTVFLIMGGGAQMYTWPDSFCEDLVSQGLQVIRFDNRDSGLSTHFTNVPDFKAAMAGDFSSVTYSLSDMAADVIGLMDALDIKSAHLVGASMGGMIAQTIAIEYPERVRSLTSMMSTTGNPKVGQPDFATLAPLGAPPRDDRQAFIEWQLRALKAIGSPKYPINEAAVAERTGLAWDRDHDPLSMLRHSVAALKSGNRTEKLRLLRVPTLVIHGSEDKMINVSGGKATAEAIPGSKLVIFEGMGHGFPEPLLKEFAELIGGHIRNAENPIK